MKRFDNVVQSCDDQLDHYLVVCFMESQAVRRMRLSFFTHFTDEMCSLLSVFDRRQDEGGETISLRFVERFVRTDLL